MKPLIHTLKELEQTVNKEIVAVTCPPSARWSVQGLPCKLPFLGSVTILPLLLIPIGHPIPVFDPLLILSNIYSEDGGDASLRNVGKNLRERRILSFLEGLSVFLRIRTPEGEEKTKGGIYVHSISAYVT